jgi:dUTP pyrophosphatase
VKKNHEKSLEEGVRGRNFSSEKFFPRETALPLLRVRKLDPCAVMPRYETSAAAGLDLTALEPVTIEPGRWTLVRTGLAIELPEGHEGQVRPRSGLAVRHGVTVLNAPGTIDQDYRGEVRVALINHGSEPFIVKAGDRVAQLVVCPVTRVTVEETDTLTPTDRGPGGFGSTGT